MKVLKNQKIYFLLLFQIISILVFSILFMMYHNYSFNFKNFYAIIMFVILYLAIIFIEGMVLSTILWKYKRDYVFERVVFSYTPIFLMVFYGLKFFINYYILSSWILFITFTLIVGLKVKVIYKDIIPYIREKIDLKLLFKFFLLGLLIKLLLLPFFYHGDFIVIYRSIHLLIDNANFNLYNEIVHQIGNLWWNFVYYPLTYIILGFFYGLFKIFLPGNVFPFDFQFSSNAPIYIFFGKLPYLFFDVLISIILLFYFKDKKKSIILFLIWWFNPIVLYSAYIFSQFDIIVTFFIILGVYLLKEKKLFGGNLLFGLGATLKMFPIIFLPGLSFNIIKKPIKSILLLLAGILPIIVSIIPFFSNPFFKKEILQNPLFSARIYESSLKLLNEKIYIFIFFYLLLFFISYYLFKIKKVKEFSEIYILFIFTVSFLFFALNRFSVHYTMWILPFICIVLIEHNMVEILIPYIIFMFLFLFKWGGFTTTYLLAGVFNLWFKY